LPTALPGCVGSLRKAQILKGALYLQRIVRDGKCAGDVIARIRGLVQKSRLTKARINLYETIEEVLAS